MEKLFKGIRLDPTDKHNPKDYMLLDTGGNPFYTDNENPYVDFKMYPTDNWKEIIDAYVRKGATTAQYEALGIRTGVK